MKDIISSVTRRINGGLRGESFTGNYVMLDYDSILDKICIIRLRLLREDRGDIQLTPFIKTDRNPGSPGFLMDMRDLSKTYEESRDKLLNFWTAPLLAKKWIDLVLQNSENIPPFDFWEHIEDASL